MSAQEVLNNLVAFTNVRDEFNNSSYPTVPSNLNQGVMTLVLAILAFISLSLTLLNRNGSAVKYFASAAVASGSIALGSIYACNFFGVYI